MYTAKTLIGSNGIFVFLDPDFPALSLIYRFLEVLKNSTQNYTFAVRYPKPSGTLKDIGGRIIDVLHLNAWPETLTAKITVSTK